MELFFNKWFLIYPPFPKIGDNASIGCVMAAIPNVHIEWEWRGRTIRNMSLMTFGRQMYLIRESHSPAGVTMSILPVNGDDTTGHNEEDGVSANQPIEIDQPLDSMSEDFDVNNVKRRSVDNVIGGWYNVDTIARGQLYSSRARRRRNLDVDETYKRTSTLYIMNALEKDSGR